MQPYRTARPHGAECPLCAPTGPGHQLCQNDGCDEVDVMQVARRHATAEEYAALPENVMPNDGVAEATVYGCDDCSEDVKPYCAHTPPSPAACPKCKATGEDPCTAKNGDARWTNHTARAAAQPKPDVCSHRHRPDCGIFTGCACTAADPVPERPKRAPGAVRGPDISGLTMPVPYAQMILHQAGHPWVSIERAWNLLTQDNRAAVAAEYYRTDDAGNRVYANGQPILDTIVVPLPVGPGRAP